MRFTGTLSKWNDDRGFGFITPTEGGQDIFVHISAFPRDGKRPAIDEVLSFEVEIGRENKKAAKAVSRPQQSRAPSPRPTTPTPSRSPRTYSNHRPKRSLFARLAPVLLVVGGIMGYQHYAERLSSFRPEPTEESFADQPAPIRRETAPRTQTTQTFRCDGRIHCSQMTSCSEAKYFLKHCPGTKMDGDGDGTPCEQQHCTGPFD